MCRERLARLGDSAADTPRSSIYRGLVTGLNEAFIIGNQTKEALIREDPRSAELLKPLVRGRDVHAYRVDWDGLWLIDTHNGYDSTPAVNVAAYPAVRRHLDAFMPALENRQDQGDTPYNLRSCAYHEKFRQPKIMWRDMSDRPRFAYSNAEIYCNDKAFVLACDGAGRDDEEYLLRYLVGVLNSAVVGWYGLNIATTTGAGLPQWKKFSVEIMPVPQPEADVRRQIAGQVKGAIEELGGRSTDDPTGARVATRTASILRELYGLSASEGRLLLAD